ncbi:hypothetical protein NH340_JMT08521 [Sarcoptes scabiei]|nr:hypothetical protein NH340_JMT08521 [Sarcoptes scabiei]
MVFENLRNFLNRIYCRLRLLYLLKKLRRLKIKKCVKQLTKLDSNQIDDSLQSYDLIQKLSFFQRLRYELKNFNLLAMFSQLFSCKLPFFEILTARKTKERSIFRLVMLNYLGFFFTLLLFYCQFYLFEKYEMKTLALMLLLAFFMIILPIFSKTAIVYALILIPQSITVSIRASMINIIANEVQVITLNNLDHNFNALVTSIRCDLTNTKGFVRKSLTFGPKENRSIKVNFLNPFETFIQSIKEFIAKIDAIFKNLEFIENIAQDVGEYVTELVEQNIPYVSVPRWLSSTLFFFPTQAIRALFNLVLRPLTDSIKKLFRESIAWIKEKIEKFKKELYIKYINNYVFKTISSNRNITFKSILYESLMETFNEHYFLEYSYRLIQFLQRTYIWAVFVLIFVPPLRYMLKFKRFTSFDNYYITDDLIHYDQESIQAGKESIFPLKSWEKSFYIRRTDLFLTSNEVSSILSLILLDLIILSYTATLLLLDSMMVFAVEKLSKVTQFILDTALPPDLNQLDTILFNTSFWHLDYRTLSDDYGKLRQRIHFCLPKSSPVEWSLYRKYLIYLSLLILFKILRPYVNRTRSLLCTRLYPEMERYRTIHLYNRIVMRRSIFGLISIPMIDNTEGWNRFKEEKKKIKKTKQNFRITPNQTNEAKVSRRFQDNFRPFDRIARILGAPTNYCIVCHKKILRENMLECPGFECFALVCFDCHYDSAAEITCPKCGINYHKPDEGFSIEIDSSVDDLEF